MVLAEFAHVEGVNPPNNASQVLSENQIVLFGFNEFQQLLVFGAFNAFPAAASRKGGDVDRNIDVTLEPSSLNVLLVVQ